MLSVVLNFLGICFICFVLWLFSHNRFNLNYKIILKAIIAQFVIAFVLVKFSAGVWLIEKMSYYVNKIISYGHFGLEFVFGSLMDSAKVGNIFVIQVLGNIIFVASLVALLTHLGILSIIVNFFGKIFSKILGTSQLESFMGVSNVFLGQSESPLLISKYLNYLTSSEVMMILVAGMGSMSASILGGYAAMGVPMNFLIIACALVPFGSVIISKILYSEDESPFSAEKIQINKSSYGSNIIEALSNGAMEGIKLVVAISASLIAVIAFVALCNGLLDGFGLKLETILSYIFYPLAFFMGFDSGVTYETAALLAEKLFFNEFMAFADLMDGFENYDYKTKAMLCVSIGGFANIGSVAICLSGIGTLCPQKKPVLAKLLPKALMGAFLMNIMNALIVGIVLSI